MCEYCNNSFGHHPMCPNYEPKDTGHYCSICRQEIFAGEEYVENEDGHTIHLDCNYDDKWLVEWLGFEIQIEEA